MIYKILVIALIWCIVFTILNTYGYLKSKKKNNKELANAFDTMISLFLCLTLGIGGSIVTLLFLFGN